MRTHLFILAAALAVAGARVAVAAEDPAAVFTAQCAKCHGETGESDTKSGKNLKVPHLKGDEKIAKMPLAEVVEKVKTNEKHKTFANKLSAEQIEAGATRAQQIAAGK